MPEAGVACVIAGSTSNCTPPVVFFFLATAFGVTIVDIYHVNMCVRGVFPRVATVLLFAYPCFFRPCSGPFVQ